MANKRGKSASAKGKSKRRTTTKKKSAAKKTSTKRKSAQKRGAKKVSAGRRSGGSRSNDPVVVAELDKEAGLEVSPIPRASVSDEPTSMQVVSGVRERDITVFLRELIMLLEAGTPIVKALNQLANLGERPPIRRLVGRIRDSVEEGNPLWQAFARESRYFRPVFVNLIKAAEASGTLTTVLRRLISYREKHETLRRQIQVALIYPAVLVFASLVVIVVISSFVVPEFRVMFEDMDVEIGGYSSFVMGFTDFVAWFWWIPVLALIALAIAYSTWWVRNPLRKLKTDTMVLRVPIAGTIVRKRMVSDFARTFALLQRSGVSVLSTLDLCRSSVNNLAFANAIQDMKDSVEKGEGFESPLRLAQRNGLFPGVVVDMMVTGEESGELDTVCVQIADRYDEEIELHIGTLREALVPMFVIIIGMVVAGVVLALYLPMFNLIGEAAGGGL